MLPDQGKHFPEHLAAILGLRYLCEEKLYSKKSLELGYRFKAG